MGQEVQKANPGLRRKVLIGAVLLALALAVGVVLLERHLTALEELSRDDVSANQAARQGLITVRILLGLMAGGAIVLAGVLARLSWRTLRAGRFPPPGSQVINDTPVLTGAQARRRGRAGFLVAVLVLVIGLWVPFRIYVVLDDLLQPSLQPTKLRPTDLGLVE